MNNHHDHDRRLAQARRLQAETKRIEAEAERLRAEAGAILSGQDTAIDDKRMLELGKQLDRHKEIGYARRLLELARAKYPNHLKIFQKCALYTYKDPDLPADWRLDRALEILATPEPLDRTLDQETLGLAGAIYKRKWEIDVQRQNLERSLFYYLKGYAQGAPAERRADILGYLREQGAEAKFNAANDQGYNGINAAFVLDLLAYQEEEEARKASGGGVTPETAEQRRQDARRIREEIIRSVPPLPRQEQNQWLAKEWWFYATVGEAYFGLERYPEALEWLVEQPAAKGLQPPEWEYESTARQLARLALSQRDSAEDSPARTALKDFLKNDNNAVRSAFSGKFGLGLSGGGFRASLFHIGALARLAELDLLRHVEVISCVSGGSIIGAHYYLELRHLLQTKTDAEIKREDYIDIVRRIEQDFLAGVQQNIRTQALAELTTNLKMIFAPGYSRTPRIGELYERELFARVKDGEGVVEGPHWLPDWLARGLGYKREPRWLNELVIRPCIETDHGECKQQWDNFKPRNHNWRRKYKVPMLILNATSLNTGHSWQFTASYMGEPPAPIKREIDANYRLRRMYYNDAPKDYQQFRLGYAVAASSCVPGLFEPLLLDGLYPDRSVRLVDGGVCDNQGVASLLEQDCTVLLVSDGSGQMEAEDIPSRGLLGVPLRSNSILQARVREAQYGDISARRRSLLLRGLMFIHLKEDLPGAAITWKDCPPLRKMSDFELRHTVKENSKKDETGYGVSVDIQRRLAAIRTDLDSFSEAEAYALMASAYRMTTAKFEGPNPCIADIEASPPSGDWRFLAIQNHLAGDGPGKRHLHKLLEASGSLFFKAWRQVPLLKLLKWVLLIGITALLVWGFYQWWDASLLSPASLQWIQTHITVGAIGRLVLWIIGLALLSTIIAVIVGRKYGKRIMEAIRWRDTLTYIAIGIMMSLFGWLFARLHLHLFDRMFLRYGKMERFPKQPREQPAAPNP